MNDKEHKQLSDKMKSVAKEVAADKDKAEALLFQTGFYEKDGSLKKRYVI